MRSFKPTALTNLIKFHLKRNFYSSAKMTSEKTLSQPDLQKHQATFETLKFDNLVLRTLPIDPITENYIREVPNACFSRVILNIDY